MPDYSKDLWEYKYAPKTIDDIILPESYTKLFKSWIDNKNPDNCLFVSAKPGVGKTSICKVIKESGIFSILFINASKETSIDNVRVNIKSFISTVSFKDAPKIVILDEGDRLSTQAADALKGEIESSANNARFIFTANRISGFPQPILSRLQVFNFDKIYVDNKKEILERGYKRIISILKSENVNYDRLAVIEIIKKLAPDWRNIIKTLQLISKYKNEISLEDIKNLDIKTEISDLIEYFKTKNFQAIRTFAIKHSGNEIQIINELYQLTKDKDLFENPQNSIPMLIILLADCNRYINIVPDSEIEMLSLYLNILEKIEWK